MRPGRSRVRLSFTEHMVRIDWDRERGWHDAELVLTGRFSWIRVAVLHYAQAVFEGSRHSASRMEGSPLSAPTPMPLGSADPEKAPAGAS